MIAVKTETGGGGLLPPALAGGTERVARSAEDHAGRDAGGAFPLDPFGFVARIARKAGAGSVPKNFDVLATS